MHPFLSEILAIFIGDVLATIFIGLSGYLAWRVLRHPGFRVGASWSWKGWDMKTKGRFPAASDNDPMELRAHVGITSYDPDVKRIVHSVWIRQRADVSDPGTILGHRNLQREGIPQEERTTGGDPLQIDGPTIVCPASKFHEVVNCPIFVQTSDGTFYNAESVGNNPEGIIRLRYRYRNALHRARQQFFSMNNCIRRRLRL